MFERFTDRARKVMTLANQEAQRFNHEYIGTEHILLGLVKEGSGVGANVLKNLDLDLRKIRLAVEQLVKSGPATVTMGRLPQTPRTKKAIEYAIEEARNLNHNHVGTEHLLLGLCHKESIDDSLPMACAVLDNLGVTLDSIKEETTHLLGAEKVPVDLMKPELLAQLQDLATKHGVVTPFSFRFVDQDQRYELLDSTGKVVDTKVFGGPVGAYTFNALRKHEGSQALLRDLFKFLSELAILTPTNAIGTVATQDLLRRITKLLD